MQVPRNLTNRRPMADKKRICAVICGQIDPFCPAACGARRFDSSTTVSVPLSFRNFLNVSQYASANGHGAVQLKASLAEFLRAGTAGTVSTFGSWNPINGYSATAFTGYRVVSMGAHIFTTSAPTTSDGVVGGFEHLGAPPNAIDLNTSNVASVHRETRYNAEFTWIARPEGSEAHMYKDITASDPQGWTSCTIFGDGLTAVNSEPFLGVEVVINCEVHADPENIWSGAMSGSSPQNAHVEAIANNVTKDLVPITAGTVASNSQSISSSVMQQVERFVAYAAPYAVDALIGAL